jgi:hypothetical protein
MRKLEFFLFNEMHQSTASIFLRMQVIKKTLPCVLISSADAAVVAAVWRRRRRKKLVFG